MARKKRIIEETVSPIGEPKKENVAYQDAFQSNVNRKIEDASAKFEGKGKNLLYALGAVAVLAILIGIFFTWNRRSDSTALTALGKAIETSQAQVSESPLPAGAAVKSFKTDKERAEAAINEFQAVADKYSGDVAQKAKYFIAVNRLTLDRAAGIQELEALSKANDEVGTMSKFALAQAKAGDGKNDEAVNIYNELLKTDNTIIAKDTINFELARIYEAQGKRQEAEDLYYGIAKAGSQAKDLEGKSVPLTQTAREARERLASLNPDRANEIPEDNVTQQYNF